jgi:Chromo (CHRromatin Organisation MOdifier) domain
LQTTGVRDCQTFSLNVSKSNKEGEEVYKVEQILKHRKHGQGYEYLIKWVGYPITKASWEPKSNLTGATDILQEYQELHQL